MGEPRSDEHRTRPRATDRAAALAAVEAVAAERTPGSRVLVTGPPGSGKSRLVAAAFDAAMERHGPDRVLLVLPTYGQVEHQKRVAISRREERRLARAILDAPYATFTSLAERLAPRFRVRDLPTRRERDLLAAEALRRADVPVFRAVRERPGFRARFLRLVKELKQTGQAPTDLAARLAASRDALGVAARERLDGFLATWAAYEALLQASGCPDHEDVLRGLLGARDATPAGLAGLALLVVDGFEDLTGVEAGIFDAATRAVTSAGGEVLLTLPYDPRRPGLSPATDPLRERLLREGGFVEHACVGFARATTPGLRRLADALFVEGAAPAAPVPPGDDVRSLVGRDAADEWDRIGREILRLRRDESDLVRSFRDVGVVLRRLDGAGVAAQRTFEALGIPARLHGGGARLSSEAVARALRGPLHVVAGRTGDGDREFDPLRLLEHGRWLAVAGRRRAGPGAGEEGAATLRAVDALELRWRRDGPPATWAQARSECAREAPALVPGMDRIEALRVQAEGLRGAAAVWAFLAGAVESLLPLPSSPGLDATGRPLDPEGDELLRRAHVARQRLVGLAREAARAAARTGPWLETTVPDAVAELEALAQETTVAPADRRLDTVHLLDAEEARHWELPVVFVAGLVEHGFPLHPREDVFLRDDDRAALAARMAEAGRAPPWRTTLQAESGERRLFLAAVTRARRRLYLTRPDADEDGRPRAPSFFWREVNEALGLVDERGPRLGTPPPDLGRLAVEPSEALRPQDLDRAVAARLGAPARAEDADALRRAVALARARPRESRALLARAARFLRGRADPLLAAHRPRFEASVARVSPTALTEGRTCLHRFFLHHVVRVEGDEAPFAGPTFDRPLHGTLVHRALELAVREPGAAPLDLARAAASERAEALRDPASAAWVEGDLVRIVTLFRRREAAAAGCGYAPLPRDLEWRFGDEGVEVSLGSGPGVFALRGTIDRLDVDEATTGGRRAIVVDYKLAPSGAKKAARRLRDLEDLQLPLYARAVEGVRDVRVVGLEHYAAARRERFVLGSAVAEPALRARAEGEQGPWILPDGDFQELLAGAERRASEVVAAVRAADHAKRPLARDDCETCPVRAVCRPDTARFRARRDEEEDA